IQLQRLDVNMEIVMSKMTVNDLERVHLDQWTSDPPIPRGIFINQDKYALEILHKHGMEKGQSIGTPMATKPTLDAELSGNPVDQTY
nr:uncharacterized mitochondrial protein AtMg00810-like [Tanacetum cinerariifolium]